MFSPTVIESNSAPPWNTMATSRRTRSHAVESARVTSTPMHLERARVGAQEPDRVLEEDALARARAAEQHDGLAGVDVEVDAVEHGARPEALDQPAGAHQDLAPRGRDGAQNATRNSRFAST